MPGVTVLTVSLSQVTTEAPVRLRQYQEQEPVPGHTEPEPELPLIDNGECGAGVLGPRPGVGHQHTMVTQCRAPAEAAQWHKPG